MRRIVKHFVMVDCPAFKTLLCPFIVQKSPGLRWGNLRTLFHRSLEQVPWLRECLWRVKMNTMHLVCLMSVTSIAYWHYLQSVSISLLTLHIGSTVRRSRTWWFGRYSFTYCAGCVLSGDYAISSGHGKDGADHCAE